MRRTPTRWAAGRPSDVRLERRHGHTVPADPAALVIQPGVCALSTSVYAYQQVTG
ncbi:hypothetical protein [Streptomyces sp. HC307]|uniref:hypothetical protein n=1 Tax=Streptomyces flavusporus TaxID=3385496 RepID=UPI003916E1EC